MVDSSVDGFYLDELERVYTLLDSIRDNSSVADYIEYSLKSLEFARDYFSKFVSSKDNELKRNYAWILNTIVDDFTEGYFLCLRGLDSMKDSTYVALKKLTDYYAGILEVPNNPIPIFLNVYSSYFPSSRSKLARSIGEKVGYYFLTTDISDSPILWPNIAHEVAHCFISNDDPSDRLFEKKQIDSSNLGYDIFCYRVGEALCDSIATRIAGIPYVYSFLNRYWHQLSDSNSEMDTHPTDAFRIKCIELTLERMGETKSADELMKGMMVKFDSDAWKQEKISETLERIVEYSMSLNIKPGKKAKNSYVEKLLEIWVKYMGAQQYMSSDDMKLFTENLVSVLEGGPISFDA